MSRDDGQIMLTWWNNYLNGDHGSAARGLSARVRRAGPVGILAEWPVHHLARELALKDGERLAHLVSLLAEIRENSPKSLAWQLGGDEPVLSPLRFQRLMRAEGDELIKGLRRAIIMADRACNIRKFGTDFLFWNEKTKINWCFDYFKEQQSSSIEETAA